MSLRHLAKQHQYPASKCTWLATIGLPAPPMLVRLVERVHQQVLGSAGVFGNLGGQLRPQLHTRGEQHMCAVGLANLFCTACH